MSASLVGSEMCIRDRGRPQGCRVAKCERRGRSACPNPEGKDGETKEGYSCLLYTSDAADDM
eukprot:4005345-Alexandrium_andersonii.AAC.1